MNPKPPLAGRIFYHFLPFRRRVILENLRIAFGSEMSESEIRRLAQSFYGHFARLFAENIGFMRMSDDEIRRRVRVLGHDILLDAARQGKGILLLTGHFGNWEISPVGSILHFPEFRGRFHVLRRPVAAKPVERMLFDRFYRAGLDIIPKKNSLGLILDALAKNDAVVFVMDQYARPDRDGIEVDFFGKKAGTFKSLALVARRSGAPVIPVSSWREGPTHVVRFEKPLEWIESPSSEDELYRNTLAYNRVLERMVREHPEQWWWPHRRWKVK